MSKAKDAAVAWLDGLKQTGAISEENWKVLEASLTTDQAAEYVGASTLMLSDYSRKQNDLKADYEAKTRELTDYQRELANWRGGTEKEVSQVKAELNQLRAERQRLVAVAQSYGLSEDDLGTPVAPFTAPVGTVHKNSDPDKPAFDAKDYLSRKEAEEMGQMYTLLPAEINDIVAEHVDLFGKQPKGMRQIVERAIKERRALRDVYEEEFKVVDKRREKDEAQREAEIKRRVDEQLTAYRTEHPELHIPSSSRQGSYVLANKDKLIPEGATPQTSSAYAGSESVRAAVTHWNTLTHDEG